MSMSELVNILKSMAKVFESNEFAVGGYAELGLMGRLEKIAEQWK